MRWQLEKLWMTLKVGRDSAKQVEAALAWINTIAQETDIIFMDFPTYRRIFYFEFPLRYGDPPKSLRRQDKKPTFIIRRSSNNNNLQDEKWQKIFSSPELEILGNKERKAAISPLRFGLTDEEKRLAIKIARDALERFLVGGERPGREYFNTLPQRFHLRTDLDVAFWVDGRLRGSYVIENSSLGEGIGEAAIGASRDSRFKPIGLQKLERTRIEITLMSPLRIPLSKRERTKNLIYPAKGHLLEYQGRKGWYLPEVFNVKRFRNLNEFLGDLTQEKAGLDRSAAKKADVFIFEVDDFIESEDRGRTLPLWGSIVRQNFQFPIFNFQSRLRSAADWLCRIQEPDGNIPPIIDSITGRVVRQIDWPRLAFTTWALAEFGKAVGEEKYSEAAKKSFEYLKSHLISNFQFQISNLELTLAYFGQLSLSLGKPQEAAVAADKILGRLSALNFEPITFAQIASFFKIALGQSIVRPESRIYFDNLLKTLKENFEKNLKSGRAMNLAVWAELVNTFCGIDDGFSQRVTEWLKSYQLSDGAFPESTAGGIPYTRGTGKIFEVLALDSDKNKDALDQALQWLFSMQYDEENTFFVPTELRPKILGGFRHDYFNAECWIDSAGHMLLGDSRLLSRTYL